jgi:hypothetical protein
MQPLKIRFKKVRFGATPKPARETRALPRHARFRLAQLLCALFEARGLAAQMGNNFAGEVE